MEPRKINIDKKMEAEEIKSTMDFDSLAVKYTSIKRKGNLAKKGTVAISAVSLIVIFVVFINYNSKENKTNSITQKEIVKQNETTYQPEENSLPELTMEKQQEKTITNDDSLISATTLAYKASKRISDRSYTSLKEYYMQHAVKSQWFNIDALRDTIIVGEQGTQLIIKANSFVYLNESPANGNITIELKECYKTEDMLKENLSTVSDNIVLESGGMIYLGAKNNSKELKLKNFAEIEMINPQANVNADSNMFLYYGDRDDKTYEINWKVDQYSRVPYPVATLTEGKYKSVETLKYFGANYKFEKGKMLEFLKNEDSLLLTISLNENKKVIGYKGSDPREGKGEALTEFLNLFNNDVNGVSASSWESTFEFKIYDDTVYQRYVSSYERYVKDNNIYKERSMLFSTYKGGALRAYTQKPFFIGNIGWINFDKEIGPDRNLNYVQFKVTNAKSESLKLTIHRNVGKSIIKPVMAIETGTWIFQGVPVGKEVTIVGTILDNGNIREAKKVIKVTDKEAIYELDYLEVELQ